MESLEFSVDQKLRLVSVNDALIKLCPAAGEKLGQVPYHQILPRLLHQGDDLVHRVLRAGLALHCPCVDLPCFFGITQARIDLQPLLDDGRVHGVQVRLQQLNQCAMAERLSQLEHLIDIGKSASALAHGVRNPLNAIKGAVVYLQRRYAAEADLLEFTHIMLEEVARLDRFITEFLSATLTVDADRTPTNLNELLQRALRMVSLQAETLGVSIRFDLVPLPPLPLNRFQVEQAVLNLLNNALAVLGPGGQIRVDNGYSPDGRFLVVKISDNGPGLGALADGSLEFPVRDRAQRGGRGFGLFLTREVMQHHGGTLEIQGASGTGTTVSLSFPLLDPGK